MNKSILTVSAAIAVFLTSNAVAQRVYNPKTVETVQGKVVSVEKTSPPADRGYGVHLTLEVGTAPLEVHLGPARYLAKQPLQIAPNDSVTVTGSRVMLDGKPALIAAEVKKGDQVMKLRDANGVPAWSGSRSGR
jgi:hypothetical protein